PASGAVYYANPALGALESGPRFPDVHILSPDGDQLGKLIVPAPGPMAVAADGSVYVVSRPTNGHFESEIFEFNPSGNQVAAIAQAKSGEPFGLATNVLSPGSDTPGDVYASSGDLNVKKTSFVTAYGPAPEFEPPPKVAPQIT